MKRSLLLIFALVFQLTACTAPLPESSGSSPTELPGAGSPATQLEETVSADDQELEAFYLQVLEDLWAVDPGLNDNIRYIGMDLSGLSHLPEALHHDLAQQFADAHGAQLLEDPWDVLCDKGYIDREYLYWEDGLYFEIKTNEEASWNLPSVKPGQEPPQLTAFDAHKWRSGTGAYFFNGCTAEKQPGGTWSYSVAYHAIA